MGQKKLARKKLAPLEDPPSSSSSSQEDEQLTDQEEEEENHYQEPPKETPSESSEDEEEQEVQDVEEKVEKTKPSIKKPITPAKPTANQSQKKKKPKVVVEEEEKKSVGAINRLWSEEDEVLILKGLIDFQSKNGSDLYLDMGEFHELIKESLSVDVSKNRFVDKIRKLKRKYSINVKKGGKGVFSRPHESKCFELSKKIWGGGKENNGFDGNEKTVKLGNSVVMPKENDGKYENKNGVNGNGESNEFDGNGKSSRSKRARKTVERERLLPEGNGKEEDALVEELKGGKMKDMEVDEFGDFWATHPCLKESLETETGMPSDLLRKNPVRRFLMENMSTIGNERAMELEKKWKNLRADEVALSLKRRESMNEQTKLVLDATNASKESNHW